MSVEHNVLKVYNVKENRERKGEKDTQTHKHTYTPREKNDSREETTKIYTKIHFL